VGGWDRVAAVCGVPERELTTPQSRTWSASADELLQSQKMDLLEKTQGWKEEDFDVVLQYMRTVLLRRMLMHCCYSLSATVWLMGKQMAPH
jgi:hypothetical protein